MSNVEEISYLNNSMWYSSLYSERYWLALSPMTPLDASLSPRFRIDARQRPGTLRAGERAEQAFIRTASTSD